jgi:hypothetical protein
MPELILPGVYIEVRPEGLIVPGPVSVGNIGIVGTARSGPVGEVRVLGSYAEARELFGVYDPFDTPETTGFPELTLVRALELAYDNGASTVFAVRVTGTEAAAAGANFIAPWAANTTARQASLNIIGGGGNVALLTAKYHGTAGNSIKAKVEVPVSTGNAIVTLTSGAIEEAYSVATGNELVSKINNDRTGSAIVNASGGSGVKPDPTTAATPFTGGINGTPTTAALEASYKLGLEQLLNENAHIILAPGLDDTAITDELKAHVDFASTDKIKRDRIAVVGSRPKPTLAQLTSHSVASDRMIFVAPGVKTTDAAKATAGAADPSVTLPGSYAAAAVAGMLSARDPHISLTNKTVSAAGLETRFTPAQLEQLVQARVLALEQRNGFRVVKAITTDSGAFRQITTRRIVDFAKFGVRSAAEPYIGLLNNDRVRKAMKGSINGFLASMVDDEMLVSYELDVTATRDEEIRGIAKVIMTVRPTFSIDYIKVVMFLG